MAECTERPAIEIQNLVKSYGTKKALDNVSFRLKKVR